MAGTAIDPIERARQVEAIIQGANHSEVARRTGITLSHVNRVLNRKRTPSTRRLQAIALALGIGMEELYAYLTYARPYARPHPRPKQPGRDGKAA